MSGSELELSIITPAWRCEHFLADYLASMARQTWFRENGDYEILLGLDGCQRTRATALKLADKYPRLKIYWFSQNHGPYIIRNTLAYLARAGRLLFFDADDWADPEMVRLGMHHDQPIMRMLQRYSLRGKIKPTWGQFFIDKDIFEGLGGFFPWRCAADGEFLKRAFRLGFPDFIIPERVLVLRRAHHRQITKAALTRLKTGPLRRRCNQRIKELAEEGVIYCEPKMAAFEIL